ncbi:hypothetical protein IFR04_003969 [Cadophora malorum]|uniref:Helix-turn-helix domain-containing protein n=1 Tax=Cadophora malorum TaxID=108018 RepID=A0A8H7WDN1_9HELO|nr:hypothetical protein IFR04_003969 [Cadophora malorum]
MGSSASKASKAASKLPSAATNSARKYPTRTPPTSTIANAQRTRPKAAPEGSLGGASQAEEQVRRQDEAVNSTPIDPDSDLNPDPALNARLKTLGPVQPNPTHSPSSTFHSHSPTTSSFADPTLSATQFQPSASNPMQTIFPSSSSPSNHTSNSSSGPDSRTGGGGGPSNPAVSLLTARYRLAGEAENEFARTGKSTAAEGRQFLDVLTLRQILVLRDEKGVEAGEIERSLGLKKGVVERLGRRGVVGVGS